MANRNKPNGPLQFVRVCSCGCGEPTKIARYTRAERGWVRGQPLPYAGVGHSRIHHRYQRLEDIDLTGRYTVAPISGCWEWQRSLSAGRYGRVLVPGGRTMLVHRVSYMQAKGPVPDGLVLDHLCRNTRCINPDHLEPVTPAENTRRGLSAKLTADDVAAIRDMAGTVPQWLIGEQFGVSGTQVGDIIRRESWHDIS